MNFKKLNKTQMTIVLSGFYIFFSLIANIASTKLITFGSFVTDAGFIYYLVFTWRDLLHKQLGKKAVLTTIYLAAVVNILATFYFQLIVNLPPETEWAILGQSAWEFIFGIQFRIVLGSILAFIFSELVDTFVYSWWVKKHKTRQWLRVFVSNSVSMPVDTILFSIIAFWGVVSFNVLIEIFWTNIILKFVATGLTFWMIYLVPEKKIYVE